MINLNQPRLALLALAVCFAGAAHAATQLSIPAANVSASSNDGNVPANTVDGSLSTRWSADATNGSQWIQYKLGGCYNVAAVNLAWYNGDTRHYGYTIQTSVDGSQWTTAFSGTSSGTSAGFVATNFTQVAAQYVRLTSTGSDVNKWVSLSDTQIMSNGSGTCTTTAPAYPGQNFALGGFTLQLPTGSSGNIDTVSGSQLEGGYTNKYYFYSDPDGAMVMMDPTTGWTTSGSLHPRTELRENAIWPSSSGTNILNASLKVTQVPSTTTIGQIFQGTGPSKPLCELEYSANGDVKLLLESTNQGGSSTKTLITNVPLGTKFPYSMQLAGSTITVKVNGTTKTFTMDSSFVGESFYFKAGNYDQSATSGTPQTTPGTVVKFYTLAITH